MIYLLQNLRFLINLKKSVLHPTQDRILGDYNRLSGDDSDPASGKGRVDFQKVVGYIANAGDINKRPSKAFGSIIINSISNSSCTIVHEVPAETTN